MEEALRLYRENYRPSAANPTPQATICVWALAADTEHQARELLRTREHWRVGFERGVRNPLRSPAALASHAYAPDELRIVEALRAKAMVGTAEQVAERLRELARRLDLDELVVVTWTFDAAARAHSYSLLAQAFALPRG